jgi:hypothetical protein
MFFTAPPKQGSYAPSAVKKALLHHHNMQSPPHKIKLAKLPISAMLSTPLAKVKVNDSRNFTNEETE